MMRKIVQAAGVVAGLVMLWGCTEGKDPVDYSTVTEYGTPDTTEFSTSAGESGSAVMFQAFSWQSHKMSKTWWTKISANAAEIKANFEWVWFPPVSNSGSANGYLPRQWQNYSSEYGTESQLRAAISDIAPAKAIGDIVINHRVGTTGWGDFTMPTLGTEQGKNYQAICSTDEGFEKDENMKKVSGSMRGAKDSGDNYDGGRDLDHTNEVVRQGVVDWLNELRAMGFAGWRYDYVRGYAAKYTGYYNAMSDAEFSVGELWVDDNSRISSWIEATKESVDGVAGAPSMAFDFAAKNALQTAFGKAETSTSYTVIPDGSYGALGDSNLLFRLKPQYAVTFVDNHDTGSTQNMLALDANDVGAAYVYILTHPGIPCVAWQHYFGVVSDSLASRRVGGTTLKLHDHIQYLISLRKALGITNVSAISVSDKSSSTYTARITGTKGEVVVSIGSSLSGCPNGFDTKYSGTNFRIHVKKNA